MKKSIKRSPIILFMLIILTATILLVGCGKSSPFIGKWNLKDVTFFGMTCSAEDLGWSSDKGDNCVEFKEDGKLTIVLDGKKDTLEWVEDEKDEKKITIKTDKDDKDNEEETSIIVGTINDDGDLSLSIKEAGMSLNYVKNK